MSSQAESISAWYAVLLWPSMVAALSVWRSGPASSSAARKKTRARSSSDSAAQPGAAAFAAAIAASAAFAPPWYDRPSTRPCAWGARTSKRSPS